MDANKPKVGDEVLYIVHERAEIVSISESRTHVAIKVLTGPQKGQMFEAPWEKIVSLNK
jgi:hypothetical protein